VEYGNDPFKPAPSIIFAPQNHFRAVAPTQMSGQVHSRWIIRHAPDGPTEIPATATVRRGQSYFRNIILNNFGAYAGQPLLLPEEATLPDVAFLNQHRAYWGIFYEETDSKSDPNDIPNPRILSLKNFCLDMKC